MAAIVVGTAGNIAMNVHLSYVLLTVSGVAAMLAGLILEFLFFSVN